MALEDELADALAGLGLGSEDGYDEEESVRATFEGLFAVHQGRNVPLPLLEAALQELFEKLGVSKTKFKKMLKSKGVCLRNAVVYGSFFELRLALLSEPELIVKCKQAKKYPFVKMCLIEVYAAVFY
ncbi:hypothetical protein Rsub_03458 [Raphidocelis subcapitata]|uniref:Uncharacterized protein n=1 Tax=Raphidocelis subcapitata TaxID=307507 RepID=A0A2V0NUX1_9CHLO|nr:hypothetical protein Rsub_03458 [Raphidocelis subcapitata]|eukprot:GBF90462.1 hypothetical protein Rsub_03458 [Raphidocelis subcapitata]